MQFRKKDLLGIKQLEPEEINLILETSETFKEISTRPIKKVPTLRGRTVVHLFYEPSTRTRTSFEIAAKRLSADTFNISASTSSIVKGETLLDTARNLEAMNPDVIVLRHSAAGAPHLLARHVQAAVINAGDGMHEHPTQALLDLLTIKDKKGTIAGQTVAIIGDIAHSRVARSNIWALTKMGARVLVAGPTTMIPHDLDKLGVEVFYRPEDVIPKADVIMMLRIQLERQGQMLLPSLREYARVFGLNEEKLSQAKPDVLIMHPGPINRGVEISPAVADGPYSVILDQVNNGVAVRMALLYLLIGGEKDE
ncbi:MAG: aspartate carbamoyltransferase catalytic subunit [Deltaproteobacteria bacterium]|jgi:aspartate carbamoyltransferase catalytic subunit|nr:aspartate carbamoyltransferase catalytic subunit [Deltaproteobacteria bacterium]MDH3801052.1 aspartate carbamoyltransferase catalytic subunit [Deltaproteobacteria bacterium]MDH3849843.1 aspartate carbamoyltransferase catalytic subunit [Deltaproteobacteria bacterium]MDH3895983.1 aspartate carbamoyltransferase catalytic subunit [Deltaproteobacteria bacterium]MDH3926400.1 aspartate carbamoyltransferase catalytic subunit [Deltaproteobacteria bacterium]